MGWAEDGKLKSDFDLEWPKLVKVTCGKLIDHDLAYILDLAYSVFL